ncbi:Rrf2 family transcriptional regulator [Lentilactobacillus senioris]|uniref:Rrf2 family transcriptional regulator n=1 Tax=Lentilactobacillus senioris TaxID=931534 RepID=UPI00228213B0|nr:Rrf2 family transcriptional regulator [Lentilactobacillus senioris]MCY9807526.1 Rrf2 family transcriptional regulator [Lentilactobacillus senioris]
MKLSTRFSDAIHILAYLKIYQNTKLSSEEIAASIMTSPVVVRRLMSKLKAAGLIQTISGTPAPSLTKETDQITLLDIYFAIEGHTELFNIDHQTNPNCIVGGNIQQVLAQYYDEAQLAAQQKLQSITLANIIDSIMTKQALKERGNLND